MSIDAVLQRMLERTSAIASLLPDEEHAAHESEEDALGDDHQHMPSVFDNLDKLYTCGGNCKGGLT